MAPNGARGMNYWESPDRSDRRFIYLQRGAVVAVNAQNGELITSFGTEGRVDLRDAMERKPAGPVGTSTVQCINAAPGGTVFSHNDVYNGTASPYAGCADQRDQEPAQ